MSARLMRLRSALRFVITSFIFLGPSSPCLAKSWGSYLASYRLGIELNQGDTASDLVYDTPRSLLLPEGCVDSLKDPARMNCTKTLTQTRPLTLGVSIQQVFERTGWFYSNFDIGFSGLVLDAKGDAPDPLVFNPQPLQNARVHLYGLNMKAYYEFGLTPPRIIPDILISIGVGGHYSRGNVKIDDVRENVEITSYISYFQFEVVWWRFKDGSLSTYASILSNNDDHKLKGTYGNYKNLYITPSQYSFAILKLVLPWSSR